MSGELVRYRLEDHVATITLNRPHRRNALNLPAYHELEHAFAEAQPDPEVRCVLVTGADPAFCSGDDVARSWPARARSTVARCARCVHARHRGDRGARVRPPLIAAVNGAAVGWGMDLTLFSDIRIASESAQFGELFIKRGLVSDMGGFCACRAGRPREGRRAALHRRRDRRAEAERIGLVSRGRAARRPAAGRARAGAPHRRQSAARACAT